jgi:hypothetical protein
MERLISPLLFYCNNVKHAKKEGKRRKSISISGYFLIFHAAFSFSPKFCW